MEDKDHELVRKLIALKRYEHPTPDYFERFIDDFHQRQRQELLHRSSWQLFFDRLNAYSDGFQRRAIYAGAGLCTIAIASVVTMSVLKQENPQGQNTQFAAGQSSPASLEVNPQVVEEISTYQSLPAQDFVMMPRPELPNPSLVHDHQSTSDAANPAFEPYISPVETINGGLLPASFRLDVNP